MVSAWSDSNEIGYPNRCIYLTVEVIPPAGESAIIHKRETKVLAPGYGTDSTERVGTEASPKSLSPRR